MHSRILIATNILRVCHVMIASGHYSVPNMPDFEGISLFPGRVLHSHDFREADEFLNQKILIIGEGYSGEDIAIQCYFGSLIKTS
jgi:trimethylamine monooxygenase